MSRTVKIPDNNRPWSATINGVTYGPYPAGSMQTVPDEVGAVIDAYNSSLPVENPPETVEQEITRIATQIADEKVGEAVIVTFEFEGEGYATASKTNGEIKAALMANKNVYAALTNEDSGTTYLSEIDTISHDGNGDHFYFELTDTDTNAKIVVGKSISYGDDGSSWFFAMIPPSPFHVALTLESATTATADATLNEIEAALANSIPVYVEVDTGSYSLTAQGVQKIEVPGVGKQLLVQAIDVSSGLLYVFYSDIGDLDTTAWNLSVFTLTPAT